MIWSDLAAAVCFVGDGVRVGPGPAGVRRAAVGVRRGAVLAGLGAAIPNLVPEDQVSWANS
jgi:hypothetical protein